jgi:hypothetical protein
VTENGIEEVSEAEKAAKSHSRQPLPKP